MTPSIVDRHLSVDEAAAYLDRRINAVERGRLDAHLSRCKECRSEVVALMEAIASDRRPRRRLLGGGLAAAAAVLLLSVARSGHGPADVSNPELRGDATPSRFVAYAPAGEVETRPLRFIWSSQKNAFSYRLTVTRATGEPVWSFSGPDTAVTMPATVHLDRDADFVWVVDALLADGTTATTGLREFTPVR
jgi:anti-sigma factor RsiW